MAFSSASNYNIEKKYGQDFTPKLNAESGVVFAIGCIKCNCVTIQMKYLGGNFMSSVCFLLLVVFQHSRRQMSRENLFFALILNIVHFKLSFAKSNNFTLIFTVPQLSNSLFFKYTDSFLRASFQPTAHINKELHKPDQTFFVSFPAHWPLLSPSPS